MKATGIVRNLDLGGRICIPRELLRIMEIEVHTPVEIYTEIKDDQQVIILQKYEPKKKKA